MPSDEEKRPLVRNSTVVPIVIIASSLSMATVTLDYLGVGFVSFGKGVPVLDSLADESMSS